jgi:hypothetical protein
MAVYFIRVGEKGPVKIGSTAGSVERRLAALQTAHHQKLTIIRVMEHCGSEQEGRLHGLYRDRRIKGEWFHFHWTMMRISERAILVEKTAKQKRLANRKPEPRGGWTAGVKAAIKTLEESYAEAYLLAGWDAEEDEERRTQFESVVESALWKLYRY